MHVKVGPGPINPVSVVGEKCAVCGAEKVLGEGGCGHDAGVRDENKYSMGEGEVENYDLGEGAPYNLESLGEGGATIDVDNVVAAAEGGVNALGESDPKIQGLEIGEGTVDYELGEGEIDAEIGEGEIDEEVAARTAPRNAYNKGDFVPKENQDEINAKAMAESFKVTTPEQGLAIETTSYSKNYQNCGLSKK
jgi:hypothetical protein